MKVKLLADVEITAEDAADRLLIKNSLSNARSVLPPEDQAKIDQIIAKIDMVPSDSE